MDGQIYYHYLSSKYALNDLENRRIKVSTLDTLNDPFELMPYRRYGFDKRQYYNKVFRDISKKWGLLCFSRSWKEQLLWSHYAEGHKGIALGFELTQDKVLEVKYTPNQKRTRFELTNNPKENEEKFLNLAKVKYQEWEYEKEYRILIKLDGCIEDDGLYFMPFGDRLKIKEIVLGCRFNDENKKEIIARSAKQLKAKVTQTRPGWEDYLIHECGTKTGKLKEMLEKIT